MALQSKGSVTRADSCPVPDLDAVADCFFLVAIFFAICIQSNIPSFSYLYQKIYTHGHDIVTLFCTISSLSDTRRSTPSPLSSSSEVAKAAKSDPSTPIEKTFVPISTEILAELADQGIDITEKPQCISDENKARLVKVIWCSLPLLMSSQVGQMYN